MIRRRFLAASLAYLAGCSGGGGGSSPAPRPSPRPSPAPIPTPRPEPLFALNVQPGGALDMLPHLKALNVRHVRVSWWEWTTPDEWSWLPAYREAGIEVLPIVYGDARRVSALRNAYGDFPCYQIGNEPDGRKPTEPKPTHAEGATVARSLLPFRHAIGDAMLVSPGLAWNRDGVTDFLAGMLSVPGAFDVLAIHTYGVHAWGEPLARCRVARSAGWQGPLWATEFGVSDLEAGYMGADPDAWQAENWRRVLSEDEARFGWDRLYGFQLTAEPGGFGLLRSDGTARPAYRWLQSWRG